MDQYRIPLPNGRALALSADQLRRIATGLGDPFDRPASGRRDNQAPPIVAALCALPPDQRAEALSVAVLRYGEKQDIESIAHLRGLSPWQVWELEESFRRALVEARTSRPSVESAPAGVGC